MTALGERLANIENNHRVPKKTSDSSKIKSSNKVAKKVKTAVTHRGLAHDLAPSSGVLKHDLPPPDKLREEARIQLEVQNRLKQLAEQAKPGNEKSPSGVGLLRSLSKIGSNGPMSSSYPVKIRTDCYTTSFLPFSGWLASAGP